MVLQKIFDVVYFYRSLKKIQYLMRLCPLNVVWVPIRICAVHVLIHAFQCVELTSFFILSVSSGGGGVQLVWILFTVYMKTVQCVHNVSIASKENEHTTLYSTLYMQHFSV
jgi:hypothetical protein